MPDHDWQKACFAFLSLVIMKQGVTITAAKASLLRTARFKSLFFKHSLHLLTPYYRSRKKTTLGNQGVADRKHGLQKEFSRLFSLACVAGQTYLINHRPERAEPC